MRHGSLFSGIGGFDLASEWMGWQNVFHCEWNPFGQKVLNYYWPNAELFTDITKSDFKKYHGTIDIISGGFPCQPYSQAGKRLGKEDERHLWPEMLRAIREVQPSYVVGENVRGLTNWNGGLVFDEVQADLESEGYEVLPFLLPACAVNAPHRRDRIWFIAYSNAARSMRATRKYEGESRKERLQEWNKMEQLDKSSSLREFSSNTQSNGKHREKEFENCSRQSRERGRCNSDNIGEVSRQNGSAVIANTNSRRQSSEEHRQEKPGRIAEKSVSNEWSNFPTQSPLCSRNDGVSAELARSPFLEWEQSFGKLTPAKHRNESIKALGNAVVPQVPFEIFKAIEAYDNLP